MTSAGKMRDGVIKRGGTYSYVVRVPDPATGRTKQRWVGGFRTQREAKQARAEAIAKLGQGSDVAPSHLTVRAYLDEWFEGQRSKLKATTHASYSHTVASYVVPHIGGVKLQQLTAPRLNAVYEELVRRGGRNGRPLSVRTVRYAHSILRKALTDAHKAGLVQFNAAKLADLPKWSPAEQAGPALTPQLNVWTADQVRSFAEAMVGERLRGAFLLAVNTGLRRGELLGLRWEDVDLDGRRMHVRHALVSVNYRPQSSSPKSGKARSFRLDPSSMAILGEQHDLQEMDRRRAGGAWANPQGLVFTREDGSPWHPDYVSKAFGRLSRRAGLPPIRLHDLRHTYATLALEAGVPIKVVSQRLGHATVQITWDVYSHVLPEQDDHAAELFHRHVYGVRAG